MNKAELIAAIAASADLPKTTATAALDAFTAAITGALQQGENVTLVGFGTFDVKQRAAREGRNPQTGAETNQGDVLALLECAGDGGSESVQGGSCGGFRQVSGCSDGGDQFGFVHQSVQVGMWPTSITSEGHHKPDQPPKPG